MPHARVNGQNVHYQVEGSGPHVTLVHGVGGSLNDWAEIVPALRPKFEVLSYDLRGHGASDKPAGPYALSDFVADYAGLLEHLNVKSTRLVGFSLGGLLAQAMALSHPATLEKVVFLSAVAGRTEEERARVVAQADTLDQGGASAHRDKAVERWFTPAFRAANADRIDQHFERLGENDPKSYAAAYRVFAESDLVSEIGQIRTPALVMTGEHDPGSNPRMSRLIHERVGGSKLVILPELRHSLLLEAPGVIADELLAFL